MKQKQLRAIPPYSYMCVLFYAEERWNIRFMVVVCTTIAMMLGFAATLLSAYGALLAPDLALRGPLGSLDKALKHARVVQQWIIHLFLASLFSYTSGLIFWSWQNFIVDGAMKCKNLDEFNFPECKGWITAISITILVLGFIVSLAFTLQSMYIRFYHPTMQVDGRKDIFFKIAEWYHKIKAAREQELEDIVPTCPNCGAEIKPGSGAFCSSCGAKLPSASSLN